MFIPEHQKLLAKYRLEHKPTKAEILFEDILKEYKVKYIKQKGFVAKCNTCLIADFYIPKPYKLIIEIDGGYHLDRKNKDYGRDRFFLFERGINTLRFTNEEVYDKEFVLKKLSFLFNTKD